MVNSDFSHRPSCHLWTKIIYFFHPNLCTFISFSCFIALARTFNSHSFPHWASSNSSEFRFSNPRNVLYHYFSSGYIHWIFLLELNISRFFTMNCYFLIQLYYIYFHILIIRFKHKILQPLSQRSYFASHLKHVTATKGKQ